MLWTSSIIVSVLTLTHTITAASANCRANNCNRAVTGTVKGSAAIASRMADCSSFMRKTVLPATITSVITTTTTLTQSTLSISISTIVNRRRQVSSNTGSIPSYASSACSNAAAYSSACSCYGIFATTITATTPVSFSTLTLTETTTTSSTTIIAVCPPNQINLKGICVDRCSSNRNACGAAGSSCICRPVIFEDAGNDLACVPTDNSCGQYCMNGFKCQDGYSCQQIYGCGYQCRPIDASCNVSNAPNRLFRLRL